jgi:hypothetical protein
MPHTCNITVIFLFNMLENTYSFTRIPFFSERSDMTELYTRISLLGVWSANQNSALVRGSSQP